MQRFSFKPSISVALVGGLMLSSGGALAQQGNEYLEMDIAQLMQITITSVAKKPQQLGDSAAAIYVITNDDIHRAGVTTVPEALRLAPGLHVARIDANKWAITSRGFSGNFANKLLVMIDGRTVYSPTFSGVYWDAQDTLLEDIDRIEVIRGPGATIWGANAVNGVINIISKNAAATTGGLVRLSGGTEDTLTTGVRYGTALSETTHARAYLSYHDSDSFTLYETKEDAQDEWDSLRGGFRIDGKPQQGDSWTLQGDLYTNNESQNFYPFWEPTFPYLSNKIDSFDSSGWNILGRYSKKLSAEDTLSLQAYYDYTSRDEALVDQTHKTLDLDLQYEQMLGKRHSMTYGLGYRLIESDFGNTFQVTMPESRSDDLYSAFIQDEITLLAEKLWLTLGIKWEHNVFTGQEWQPSARILYKVNDKNTLWAAVSRAVRTPSQFEESGSLLLGLDPTSQPYPLRYTMNGDEAYDAEDLMAYELGYRWLPASNLSLDFAVFINQYDNLRNAQPVSMLQYNELALKNNFKGTTYGVELATDWKPLDRWRLQLSYAYMGYDMEVENSWFGERVVDITEGGSPKHQVSLLSSLDVLENLQLNLWLRYVDSIETSNSVLSQRTISVDDYVTLDCNLAWQLHKNVELMLVGQNLLDSSHLEYVTEFSTKPTEVERSVYAKVTFTF